MKRRAAEEVAELAASKPHLKLPVPDFAKDTWEELRGKAELPKSRSSIPFSPRFDGCNRPVPNVVLKVPTGGGKTWLAISAVSRILGRYLERNTGFVLWIVPNEAIYTQTLKHLKDRQHPYRQAPKPGSSFVHEPGARYHYQTGTSGRMGLPVCVRALRPRSQLKPPGNDTACRSDFAPAGGAEDWRSLARRVSRHHTSRGYGRRRRRY